jgi:hypothetical protein
LRFTKVGDCVVIYFHITDGAAQLNAIPLSGVDEIAVDSHTNNIMRKHNSTRIISPSVIKGVSSIYSKTTNEKIKTTKKRTLLLQCDECNSDVCADYTSCSFLC